MVQDWKRGDIALVTSPFFSHGIRQLYEALQPIRIIFAIGEPRFTVQSMYNKGFYEQHYLRDRTDLALGFQPAFPQRWYWLYLFARLVPNGEYYKEWETLTRIGKISWFGSMVHRDIWQQLQSIPQEKIFIFNLQEVLTDYYGYYKNFANEFGLAPLLSEKSVQQIRQKGIKSWHNKENSWSDQEQQEFEELTKEWTALYKRLSSIPAFSTQK